MDTELERTIEEQVMNVAPMVRAKIPETDFGDVMQDVRISFWIGLPAHRAESRLETYAFTIARRRVVDYWRRAYAEKGKVRAEAERMLRGAAKVPESESKDNASLTRTEKEIFRMVGRGMTNDEIERTRFISHNTLRTHLRHIYRKLNLRGRVNAAVLSAKILGG